MFDYGTHSALPIGFCSTCWVEEDSRGRQSDFSLQTCPSTACCIGSGHLTWTCHWTGSVPDRGTCDWHGSTSSRGRRNDLADGGSAAMCPSETRLSTRCRSTEPAFWNKNSSCYQKELSTKVNIEHKYQKWCQLKIFVEV